MEKHFVVSIFIFNKSDEKYRILLLEHKKLKKWVVPGGHIEDAETPIEATIREVWEETNLSDYDIVSFKHSSPPLFSDSCAMLSPEWMAEELIPSTPSESLHSHLDLFYIAQTSCQKVIPNLNESKSIKWVDFDALDTFDTFDSTKYFAKEIAKCMQDCSPNKIYKVENRLIKNY